MAEALAEQVGEDRGRRAVRQRRQPGGRPYKHTVRLSDQEQLQIEARAIVAGVSIPRLLKEAALAGDERTASERRAIGSELAAVRRFLAALSNNVNQLAMVANSTGEVPPQLVPTMHAVARATARLNAVMGELTGVPANAAHSDQKRP